MTGSGPRLNYLYIHKAQALAGELSLRYGAFRSVFEQPISESNASAFLAIQQSNQLGMIYRFCELRTECAEHILTPMLCPCEHDLARKRTNNAMFCARKV